MALSKVEVNLPALGSVIDSMESEQASLEQQIKAMYDSIMELNAMWTGTAASTFQARAGKDYQVMQNHVKELKKITTKYREASKDYQSCESKVASAVAAIKI